MSNLLQVRWFFNKKLDLEIQYKIGLSFFRILKYNNEIQMTFTPKLTPRTFLLNPLSAHPPKWSNTLKQILGKLPTNCLSVFNHFVWLALKGLKLMRIINLASIYLFKGNDGTSRTMLEICLKLTIKALNPWSIHLSPNLLLLVTLSRFRSLYWCFHYLFLTSHSQLGKYCSKTSEKSQDQVSGGIQY